MTQNYFTPIINGDVRKNDAAIWNDPLGELDAAIGSGNGALQSDIDALQDALSAIIIDDGTGNAEVIAARTRIPYLAGTPPALLGDTIEYVNGGVANVVAFGADKTGVANSSAAVQAAINAADTVYFPPGTYLFNTIVTTGSNKTITGRGATLKIGTATPLRVTGNNVIIEGLKFVGTRTDHTTGTSAFGGECLYIDASANREDVAIRNCHFSWASRGIWFQPPATPDPTITFRNFSVTGCTFRDLSENAITWRQSGGARGANYSMIDVRISNCHFEDCWFFPAVYMGGIYIGGGVTIRRLAITGCTAKNVMTAFVSATSLGLVDAMTVTGCHISGERTFVAGEANSDKIKMLMGLDLSGVRFLSVSGCSFDFIQQEAITVFTVTQFSITGCTFRRSNVGIATNHDNLAAAGVGSRGAISGCTFTDMGAPDGYMSNRWAIQISDAASSAAPAHITITGCRFDLGASASMTGILFESVSHPDIQISACSFTNLTRGIYASDGVAVRTIITACRFEACTVNAILSNGNFINSVIAHCIFESNAIDISAATTTNSRFLGNTHNGTTGTALFLQNANNLTITDNLFADVATVHGGINSVSNPSHNVLWMNNTYTGTSTAPASNPGYIQLNYMGQKSFLSSLQPATGQWVIGDIAWDFTPSASGFIGWVCTASGTPGTWKGFGAIAA